MAKRPTYCNEHDVPFLRKLARTQLDPRVMDEMARLRFCPTCGVWVPTPNAAAANVVGFPVTFVPNPRDYPEATIPAFLTHMAINSAGQFTGRLVAGDGRVWDDGRPLADRVGPRGPQRARLVLLDALGSPSLAAAR